MRIHITGNISLDDGEIQEQFIRASGPGGQNVNKVATAVCLRFDIKQSGSLPGQVKDRLIRLGGRRITKDGVLVIKAERYRSLRQNRRDAMDRLISLVVNAAKPVAVRRRTRPTQASVQRRLNAKQRRGSIKKSRGRVDNKLD